MTGCGVTDRYISTAQIRKFQQPRFPNVTRLVEPRLGVFMPMSINHNKFGGSDGSSSAMNMTTTMGNDSANYTDDALYRNASATSSSSNNHSELNDTAHILHRLASLTTTTTTTMDSSRGCTRAQQQPSKKEEDIAMNAHSVCNNQQSVESNFRQLYDQRLDADVSLSPMPIQQPHADFRPYISQPILLNQSMTAYMSGLQRGLALAGENSKTSSDSMKQQDAIQHLLLEDNLFQKQIGMNSCDAEHGSFSNQKFMPMTSFSVGTCSTTSSTPDDLYDIDTSTLLLNPTTRPGRRNRKQTVKICRMEGCATPAAKRTPYCSQHSGPRRCEFSGCEKGAQGRTRFCIGHGGGRRCIYPSCNKGARDSRYCAAHGGGKRCEISGCSKSAVGGSTQCTAHGGGKRCKRNGCDKSAQSATPFCVKHGGGRKCNLSGCEKVARGKTQKCMVHSASLCMPVSQPYEHTNGAPDHNDALPLSRPEALLC